MMIMNEGAFMKNKISDKNMFQNFEVKAYWFLNDNQNSGSYGFLKWPLRISMEVPIFYQYVFELISGPFYVYLD